MKQGTIDDLIRHHEGLVFFTLNQYNCIRTPEVLSVAYEALWRAIETFDKNRGVEFSTYAVRCIRNAAYNEMRKIKELNEMEVLIDDAELIRACSKHEAKKETTYYKDLHIAVDEALNKLSGKKLSVAKCWLSGNKSDTAIAQEVSCSQSYASQSIKEFKVILRKELTNAGYCRNATEDSTNG